MAKRGSASNNHLIHVALHRVGDGISHPFRTLQGGRSAGARPLGRRVMPHLISNLISCRNRAATGTPFLRAGLNVHCMMA